MKLDSTLKKVAVAIIPFVLLLIFIAAFICSNPLYNRAITRPQKISGGTADLSENPLGINLIQGEWLFWWKAFVTDPDAIPAQKVCVLPGAWKNAGITDRFGYASYGLKVTGLDPAKMYVFRIGQTLSACNIVINGQRLISVGRPGTTLSEELPGWNSALARFKPRADGTAGIILQISNHYDRFGGSNASIYLGESSQMYKMDDIQILTEGFVFSILLIMGFFFLALFLYRHKEIPFLWFAGICTIVGFRTLCYDGFVLLDLFPAMSWPVYFKLGYLTFPLAMICLIGFLQSIFPVLVRKTHFWLIAVLFGIDALLICFAPIFASAFMLPPFQLVGVGAVLYGVSVIIRAVYRRLESARWLLVGFSFAFVTFTYDILVSMWIISGFSLSHLGMSLCLFCLALMVIERYSSSFAKTRMMAEQLQIINRSLCRFVPAEFLAFLKKDSISDVKPGDSVEADMAILSADIRSFTSMAEKMTPDDIFAFLNEYLELVGPIIRASGGFIAKYEGDGFFALFPHGSEAAVHCAIQLQSAITCRNRSNPGKKSITIGIGIDSGKLTLGTIGDNFRMDGAVISSCVKCADKLESATKLYMSRILVNETVFAELSDPLAYFLRPVDRMEAGGKSFFLFEIYNNDNDELRDLKWKTQGDLEHAVFSYFSGELEESKSFLSRVLAFFPDDPVAQHYARRLQL